MFYKTLIVCGAIRIVVACGPDVAGTGGGNPIQYVTFARIILPGYSFETRVIAAQQECSPNGIAVPNDTCCWHQRPIKAAVEIMTCNPDVVATAANAER